MPKLKKPAARGPAPADKAQIALGQKLNRKEKPPPDPALLDRKEPVKQERGPRPV